MFLGESKADSLFISPSSKEQLERMSRQLVVKFIFQWHGVRTRAAVLARTSALEQRAKQSWNSHRVVHWKSREKKFCSVEQMQNLTDTAGRIKSIFQEHQQDVQRFSKFQVKLIVSKSRVEQNWKI